MNEKAALIGSPTADRYIVEDVIETADAAIAKKNKDGSPSGGFADDLPIVVQVSITVKKLFDLDTVTQTFGVILGV